MTRTVYKSHERKRVSVTHSLPSRTKQSFAKDCDINNIIASWSKSGELNHVNLGTPQYGDFSNADDYLTARNNVSNALESFDLLPSEIRAQMGNDPAVLLDFIADPSNHEEAVQLGLLPPPAPPERPQRLNPPKPPEGATAPPPLPDDGLPPSPIEGGE